MDPDVEDSTVARHVMPILVKQHLYIHAHRFKLNEKYVTDFIYRSILWRRVCVLVVSIHYVSSLYSCKKGNVFTSGHQRQHRKSPVPDIGHFVSVKINRRACLNEFRQTSHIRCTLIGNTIVDHSGVVGAPLVIAVITTSSFSTEHLTSIDWTMTTARRDEKHVSVGIRCAL